MCLAILKPQGIQVPRSNLITGWQHNPDGAGYAFTKDGRVVIRNGFMKLKEFINAYEVDEAVNQESNFLIHFRITSQGSSGPENTHPFPIANGALIHNGTLTGTGSTYGTGPSDTKKFTDMFGKDLTFTFVEDHKSQLGIAVRGSKLAMLYDDNKYQIVNEADGNWNGGVWYSNLSWKSYKLLTPAHYDDTEDDLPWQ